MMLRPLRRRYFEAPDILFRYTAGAPGLTTTRSSPATYRDRSGTLRTAAPNVLRTTWQDGRPYALVEGAAANVTDYSEPTLTHLHAHHGCADAGPAYGYSHWLEVEPHTGATPYAYVHATIAEGQEYVASVVVRMPDGSPPPPSALIGRVQSVSIGAPTEWRPLGAGLWLACWDIVATAAAHWGVSRSPESGDAPVLVTGFSVESGPLATSYIPTDGAPATRDRDLVSVDYHHAPGSLAVLEAGREAGLSATHGHAWQIGGGTTTSTRALQVRARASTGHILARVGNGSDYVDSIVPLVPMGAEYQRLALLDVQDTEARVRLMQRHREGGAWVEADGGWSSPLDVSELLALGWRSPHLTIGNVREGTRAGRMMLSDMAVLDLRGRDAEALTIEPIARRFGL